MTIYSIKISLHCSIFKGPTIDYYVLEIKTASNQSKCHHLPAHYCPL